MATPEGKITALNLSSLQATGLSANWQAAPGYAGDQRVTIDSAGADAWFGPFQPIAPMAPQTAGRAFNYPVGSNLAYIPRGDASVTFEQLRALADNLPMLRIVIEKRKDQIAGWQWDVQPKLAAKDKRRAPNADVASDLRVEAVRDFLRRPDRRRPFHTWLRALVEDMLVADAACLYPRLTNGGDLFSLDVIDGSTIKVLIGEDGRMPLPEEGPAYQQILHGIPASDFALDELMYLPRNIRSNRLYGYSPVEQVILTVNIALRREMMTLDYYNSGTLPEGFGTLPTTWTADQIQSFQERFDSLMSGNLANRRKLRFMPEGFKYTEARQPPLKDMYDEWLWRIICAAFGVSPSGVVADVNRATAQTLQLQAANEGIGPLKAWVKEIFDDVIQRLMGFRDLEFRWQGEDDLDPLEQAQALQILVGAGIKTKEEARVELGLGPMSAADKAEADKQSAPTPTRDPAQGRKPALNTEVGKSADVPFPEEDEPATRFIPYPRAKTESAVAAIRLLFLAGLDRQRQQALAAVEATLSKAADDAPSEDTDADRIANDIEDVISFDHRYAIEHHAEDVYRDAARISVERLADQIAAERAGAEAAAEAAEATSGTGVAEVVGEATANVEIVFGAGAADMFDAINQEAVDWASQWAADLVSQVSDTTRDAVRRAVTSGMADGLNRADIAAKVQALGAFSEKRADLIAATEIRNANEAATLGSFIQASKAGVSLKKTWMTGGRPCPVCAANAGAGPVELTAAFPSGDMQPTAHPRCQCALGCEVGS